MDVEVHTLAVTAAVVAAGLRGRDAFAINAGAIEARGRVTCHVRRVIGYSVDLRCTWIVREARIAEEAR
jgi:hypothetical protein